MVCADEQIDIDLSLEEIAERDLDALYTGEQFLGAIFKIHIVAVAGFIVKAAILVLKIPACTHIRRVAALLQPRLVLLGQPTECSFIAHHKRSGAEQTEPRVTGVKNDVALHKRRGKVKPEPFKNVIDHRLRCPQRCGGGVDLHRLQLRREIQLLTAMLPI